MTIVFLSFGVQTTTLRPNKSLFEMLCLYVYFPFIVIKRTCLIHTGGFLNIYMLFTGWEVRIGRNCTASGGTQTEGTVSPNMDRPRPVNNIFISFLLRFKSLRKILLQPPTYVC